MFSMTHHPQLLADFAAKHNSTISDNYVFLFGGVGEVVWRHYEVGLDVMLGKVLMSLGSVAILHLIVAIEIHQGLWCDVNTTGNNYLKIFFQIIKTFLKILKLFNRIVEKYQSFMSDSTTLLPLFKDFSLKMLNFSNNDKIICYPGTPALSMMLARVTSLDHTSNCHFRKPRTPQCTLPHKLGLITLKI